jgi:bifunctional UDP-N-acetylglucosamine pyrophosphorylase / glucosamine-1-phosphate N-acetyltransferase
VNTSHYCFDSSVVFPLLSLIDNNNDQKEYYLTDIIQLLSGRGELVETITVDDPMVLRGINTREELLEAEAFLKKRDS